MRALRSACPLGWGSVHGRFVSDQRDGLCCSSVSRGGVVGDRHAVSFFRKLRNSFKTFSISLEKNKHM